ncbi:hypothetical protein ACFOQM_09620 [Paenibacillus sp. GCM10012307]|uniref:hypothetical protein n=1 Tax=Paenibacillus TaxID=44249 RepID=UPI001E4691EA|nr:hypothetical protein [Paenibacillus roseus]
MDYDDVWKIQQHGGTLAGQQEHRLLFEFIGFVRTYLQARDDLQSRNLLDAHSNALGALHHWARIELIEKQVQPETSVWRQIRRYHPGIHKLYEELTGNDESLEQRLKLVMLGCEFSLMDKMKSCSSLIFQVLKSREEPWSLTELQDHASLSWIETDLSLLVNKLLARGYIREVAVIGPDGSFSNLEMKLYSVV